MPQTLNATGRIILQYTISSVLHKLFVFVRNPQLVGSVWQINSRAADANDLPVDDAITGLALALESILPGSTSGGTCTLETRSGLIWTPVHSVAFPTITPVGNAVPAAEITATFRDSAFHKLKVVLSECETQPPAHAITLVGAPAAIGDCLKQWTSAHSTTNPPYNWAVSMSNLYLNTASFIAYTVTFNKHLRRIRGYL